MRLRIEHRTRHTYAEAVSFGDHRLFLRPMEDIYRRLTDFRVETQPASKQRWVSDAYGNAVLCCNYGLQEATKLEFLMVAEVELVEINPFDFILESYAVRYPFEYRPADQSALQPFMDRRALPGALKVIDWFYRSVSSPLEHHDVVQFITDINEAIRQGIEYIRRDEEGIQDPDTTLMLKSGSCRDMAVLFVAILRQLGFAARFCSGYLYDPPAGEDGAHLFNRAAGSMHAWAEVYLPGAGWKGFDPTNAILANSYFLPCATAHDPEMVEPIQGAYFANASVASEMDVRLEIERIDSE